MSAPTGADLLAYLNTATKADQVVATVAELAKSYTRGRGFNPDPEPDIRVVIVTAAARLYQRQDGAQARTMGPFQVQFSAGEAPGWTVAELAVLNRYRERAQ